jgi:hypothetical protein
MFQGSSARCNYTHDDYEAAVVKERSSFDSGFSQADHCRFRGDRRIVNLLERIGASLGRDDGQNFDVPVIVVVDGLPISQALRAVQAVGRSVEDEVELLSDGANALQGAAKDRAQVPHAARP